MYASIEINFVPNSNGFKCRILLPRVLPGATTTEARERDNVAVIDDENERMGFRCSTENNKLNNNQLEI